MNSQSLTAYELSLYSKGYRQQPDGSWGKPSRSSGGVDARNPVATAKLESNLGNEPLGETPIQAGGHRRVLVRVTSFRRRLLDEDNLCEKFLVDCCRFSGLLQADDPRAAKIEVAQEQVGSKEREFVRITIEPFEL